MNYRNETAIGCCKLIGYCNQRERTRMIYCLIGFQVVTCPRDFILNRVIEYITM